MTSEMNPETINYPPQPPGQVDFPLQVIHPHELESELLEQESPPELPKQLFSKGKFLYISDLSSREMLVNAWNAITELNLWDYMRQDTYSYMLSNDNEINLISRKMEELGYDGHSGCSFGWTMRQMQYIAKNGEKTYADEYMNYNKN